MPELCDSSGLQQVRRRRQAWQLGNQLGEQSIREQGECRWPAKNPLPCREAAQAPWGPATVGSATMCKPIPSSHLGCSAAHDWGALLLDLWGWALAAVEGAHHEAHEPLVPICPVCYFVQVMIVQRAAHRAAAGALQAADHLRATIMAMPLSMHASCWLVL